MNIISNKFISCVLNLHISWVRNKKMVIETIPTNRPSFHHSKCFRTVNHELMLGVSHCFRQQFIHIWRRFANVKKKKWFFPVMSSQILSIISAFPFTGFTVKITKTL